MASLAVLMLLCASMVFIKFVCGSTFVPHMEETRCSDEECNTEKWGYAHVREGAHMFWWLYYTTHPDGYQTRPWIIWLQGGPGLSGTGLGNFLEIGPLNQNLTVRATTWVQEASVLFIDQPVGTGFSYVETWDSIPVGIHNISFQLIDFLDVFLQHNPEFKTPPLYLFGQSYGGKYAPALAYHIKQADHIEVNLQGVAIGNGFVSPIDVLLNYGPLLYHMGFIDNKILSVYSMWMKTFVAHVEAGQWVEADDIFWLARSLLFLNAPGLNFYNIMDLHPIANTQHKRSIADMNHAGDLEMPLSIYEVDLKPLMNSAIKRKLRIIPDNLQWSDSEAKKKVIQAQKADRMKDVIYMVEWLLEESDVEIIVYEGQLDMACETAAAVAWVDRLNWTGNHEYWMVHRKPLTNPNTGYLEMFVKSHGNLKFYWNIGAGHAVPADTPEAALRMLRRILNNEDN